MMNNKGFTLIELLVSILVLVLVVGVTVVTVNEVFLSAKDGTEVAFVEELEKVIKNYLAYSSLDFSFDDEKPTNYTTHNCDGNSCFIYKNDSDFTLRTLVNKNFVSSDKLINPKGEKQCILDTEVEVYRDSDFVYCFYVNLENAGCYDGYVSNCEFASEIGN